jgi:ribosomal protein S18 acetylase RimI-like enzyme
MRIIPAQSKKDLQDFIDLPYSLYKDDPVWVAPLRNEQKNQFIAAKNPMLDHCRFQLFLLKNDNRVVGRIAAFIDQLALNTWKKTIGLFGSFECINDPLAAQMLLNAARNWLSEQKMSHMRGPWSFASQEWGLVVEGFTPPPVILAPYNPPYYNLFFESFGLIKEKDLIVYIIDAGEGYQVPERYLTLTDRIEKRFGVTVRPVNMHNLEEDVITIMKIANKSIADNWGFYPITEAESRAMARDLKQIVNPNAVLIAENKNSQPIGFAISLPDINLIIKDFRGSLLPFNWLKLLLGLKKINQYRMWALGIIPEYQGKAIDTLLYKKTYEAIYNPTVRVEINYVLEDNQRMNNALMRLGVKPLRRYRVYEMEIYNRPNSSNNLTRYLAVLR